MSIFKFRENSPVEYCENHLIKTYQTSMHKKVSIAQLLSLFQEIAGGHTSACGVGWERMADLSLFWALSRLKIEVVDLPGMNDQIKLKTWSRGYKGLFAYREFLVTNASGQEMVKASSMWIMVNLKSRRPCRIADYMEDFPRQDVNLFDKDPQKVKSLVIPAYSDHTKVGYSELDINQHLNNTSYLNRILNNFDTTFHARNVIKKIELNFIKEAREGDCLAVGNEQISDKSFRTSVIDEKGCDKVRAEIEWREV